MSCRRAFELDLPAFVIDPRDPVWDDFRAHYPRCAECSAEVAAWSALQTTLTERHPEPEELLRWNDAPSALSSDARAAIERHVECCASCRDELRALARFAAEPVGQPATTSIADATVGIAAGAQEASAVAAAAHHLHHASASRAGGRHGEQHAFARRGSVHGESHVRDGSATERRGARRGPIARVLLHPAFAYAVLALVLLLPTVRAALDRDAGRGAFELAATRVAEQAQSARPALPPAPSAAARPDPASAGSAGTAPIVAAAPQAEARRAAETDARQPITAKVAHEHADAPGGGAPEPDDAHVDHTAPRLVRQAPFRPAQAPPPPAAAPAAAAARSAGDGAGASADGDSADGLRRERVQSLAEASAEATLRDTAATNGARALHSAGTGDAIKLLPAAAGGARTLIVTLPPSAAASAAIEIRVVDRQGGRELRQRVARPPGAPSEVQTSLPSGFSAAELQVEIYADGAGPVLQGTVTP
jgi:hypothetical protein